MEAMVVRYGPIGWVADDKDDLFRLVDELNLVEFARPHSKWVSNLRALREARRPELLAKSYAASIQMINQGHRNGPEYD
jgi:hypothetical protein